MIEWNVLAVTAAPTPPYGILNLLTPADHSIFDSLPIDFSWDTLRGATMYEFQMLRRANDATPALQIDSLTSPNLHLTHLPGSTLPWRFWRVRSLNAQGYSDWSDMWRIRWNGSGIEAASSPSTPVEVVNSDGRRLLTLSPPNGTWQVELSDMLGREIAGSTVESGTRLRLPPLNAGIYPLRLIGPSGERSARAIILP